MTGMPNRRAGFRGFPAERTPPCRFRRFQFRRVPGCGHRCDQVAEVPGLIGFPADVRALGGEVHGRGIHARDSVRAAVTFRAQFAQSMPPIRRRTRVSGLLWRELGRVPSGGDRRDQAGDPTGAEGCHRMDALPADGSTVAEATPGTEVNACVTRWAQLEQSMPPAQCRRVSGGG